jgi:addiction module HigA family antidote
MAGNYPTHGASNHPGEILLEEFLKPSGASQAAFARHIGVDPVVVNEIVNGRRGLSAEMCFTFSAGTGCSPEFWWGLQEMHEFSAARQKLNKAGRIPAKKVFPAFTAACRERDRQMRAEELAEAAAAKPAPRRRAAAMAAAG